MAKANFYWFPFSLLGNRQCYQNFQLGTVHGKQCILTRPQMKSNEIWSVQVETVTLTATLKTVKIR